MSGESSNKSITRHWPTMLLGLIVAAIFLTAIFTYQVKSTEWAVVTTFGIITNPSPKEAEKIAETNKMDITTDNSGGLFPRWPYPIQRIYKFDKRMRCFDGSVGKLDETLTSDKKNVIVGIYVIYRISDPVKFFQKVVNIPEAENKLNNFMRTSRNSVIGRYAFEQLINTNPKKMRLDEIEKDIQKEIAFNANKIGIAIDSVGIKSIGLPEKITEKVFKRMITERQVAAAKYRSDGKKEAEIIKAKANKEKMQIESDAKAKAKTIRAEGDAQAAAHYAIFRKNPELAVFLRKLDSLGKIMKTKTTLVLDTDSAPFDLFKLNTGKLGPLKDKDIK
jgi:membrane protease subunit HflC